MISRSRICTWLCGGAAFAIFFALLLSPKPWLLEVGAGSLREPIDFLRYYGWWTGLFNACLFAVLAFTARWWTVDSVPVRGWWPAPPIPRWFIPCVALAMVANGFFSAQRLGFSLWDDEANSVRRVISGKMVITKEGQLKVRNASWEQTFWNYERPTNHHLQSILSKASLEVWRAFARPKGLPFSETAMRMPSFLAGLLAIAVMAFGLWRMGFPRAGIAAALILGLHPWFIRYASELRGYALALLFAGMGLLFLLMALESGRWRWWGGMSLSWLAMMYAYPGTFFFVVVLSAAAFAAILIRNPAATRASQLGRWLVCSLLAGMVLLQLMVPCVPQVGKIMNERLLGQLTPRWHRNLLAHFLTGTPWNNSDIASAGYPELQWAAEVSQPLFSILLAVVVLATFAGLARVTFRRPAGWIAAALWTIPAFALYLTARVKGQYLYEWYLIFALPGAVACFALGIDLVIGPFKKHWRFAPTVGLSIFVLVFAILTQPARHRLVTVPLQSMRETVAIARPLDDLMDPAQNTVLTAQVGVRVENYDPRIRSVITLEDLLALLAMARESNLPLYLITSNPWAVAAQSPELLAALRDPEIFEEVASFQGFDPTLTMSVFRMRTP